MAVDTVNPEQLKQLQVAAEGLAIDEVRAALTGAGIPAARLEEVPQSMLAIACDVLQANWRANPRQTLPAPAPAPRVVAPAPEWIRGF